MWFYQAYVNGSGRQFELRSTQQEAVDDLKAKYECTLVDHGGLLFDNEKNMGVAHIHI